MPGQLFTHYFLTDGIKATAEWKASVAKPEAFAAFKEGVRQKYDALSLSADPNESTTELDLIRPVLDLLGWTDYLPQQGSTRNEDIPDHLLFADAGAKRHAAAKRKPHDRYRDALVVEENKRFGLALDTRDENDKTVSGTPHGQILRYLSTAEVESDGGIRWGILTNGGVWRLYDYRSRPRASGYFEADLAELLEPGNEDGLRVFHLLLRRDSFTLQEGAKTTFLEAALAEGRRYEERVAQDLSGVVFARVFPRLVQAIADATGKSLAKIREAALIFLYRLLFVLYAEDRGLLPVNDSRYDDYGLRKRVRDDIARRMADKDTFSSYATSYYDHLMTLFRLIDKGDTSIGLPPYNGGLFAAATLLEEARLSDETIAPIIYDLSHTTAGERRFVNYRDMSVQQLGSIYERLLEHEPVRDNDGKIVIRPNPYARKDSGSFFTPQELVDLIVERTLKPLAEERLKAFEDKAAQLKSDRRSKAQRKAELLKLDPAEAVLNLKVLDPAMGSGHFLVTAVDFLSDYVADLIEYVPDVPAWRDAGYVSPLVKRVAAIRKEILQRAREADWVMDESQLTDQAIIRRMVLKRCIYGVDKNPLTVELAKVSLWLHSFTVGAPLSFLDHHLRYGDSLVGLRVGDATDELHRLGGMFASSAIAGAEATTAGMQSIEEMSDADVAEVRKSAALFHGVEKKTAELRGFLDFLCGFLWHIAGKSKKERPESEDPLISTLGHTEDAFKLLAQGPEHMGDVPPDSGDAAWSKFAELWYEARSIADREGFLHWEVAFPGVWRDWQSTCPEGGFDAVIGNPPWDRIKLQEVEWFATRDPELALAQTAAARGKGVQRLRDRGSPLVAEFDNAKHRADRLGQVIRASGDYPLLSGGDINLYSLFVERAMTLVKPDGLVGLLTPIGIATDITSAPFFAERIRACSVKAFLAFENRRGWLFPDIHHEEQPSIFVFAPSQHQFSDFEFCVRISSWEQFKNSNRRFRVSANLLREVNPNTETAPIFRTRRDAELTTAIYRRLPVLVDRSSGEEVKAWPVKYSTMFHMTNDSHLFRTREELEEQESAYPIGGNQFFSTSGEWVPLYEGKMVQIYNHRYASVRVNPKNISGQGVTDKTLPAKLQDPAFVPHPRYWVNTKHIPEDSRGGWRIGFNDICNTNNARSLIACIVPDAGFGNTLPILSLDEAAPDFDLALLVANLCALVCDYVARQKIQSRHLNKYILEQLPVVPPTRYEAVHFGLKTAGQIVREAVLELTYTSHDMAPFARDMGHVDEAGKVKQPFTWDEEERRHLRARLDALYFHLYGLTKEDAEYVLDTFPIVRKEDEAAFGHYRTRDLILAYMNALSAGDTETQVAV